MDTIRIRVERIVDFGLIVGVIGTDLASNEAIVVHIDHRPLTAVYGGWKAAGLSEGLAFTADNLTFQLGVDDTEVPLPAA
jgi:hypothetical protein